MTFIAPSFIYDIIVVGMSIWDHILSTSFGTCISQYKVSFEKVVEKKVEWFLGLEGGEVCHSLFVEFLDQF